MKRLKIFFAVIITICNLLNLSPVFAEDNEIIVNVHDLDASTGRYYERITMVGTWTSPGTIPDYLDTNTYVEATNRQGNAGVFTISDLEAGNYDLYFYRCVHKDDDPAANIKVQRDGEKIDDGYMNLTAERGWTLVGNYTLHEGGSLKFTITKMTADKWLRVSAVKLVRVRDISLSEDYRLLDWEPVGGAYWNSTDIEYPTELISAQNRPDVANLNYFVSSGRMFTKEEIPKGSIIEIEEGYQYRPEAWEDLGQQSTRPDNVSVTRTVVDEQWWGNYQYKAFNVSSVEYGTKINDKVDEVKYNLRIYIPVESKDAKKVLKILAVGNSFSANAMDYLYDIAKQAGYDDVVLGNLYIGGCTLDKHCENATYNLGAYEYQKNTTGRWTKTAKTTLYAGVTDENWDYVTIQQASGSSGVEYTYRGAEYLASYVRYYVRNDNVKIGWHMTWAYQQTSNHGEFYKYNNDQVIMYNQIVNSVKNKIIPSSNIDFIIPAGTAIQNIRTSIIGDNLTLDGYHLNAKGRYAVGLMWLKTITGTLVDNISWVPEVAGITDEYLEIIKESVNNAANTPYEVTLSKYSTNPEEALVADYENYELLNMEIKPSAYWVSTSGTELVEGKSNCVSYIASGRLFAKEDIPKGSFIEIDYGYCYRPEGWVLKEAQGSRPGVVTTKRIYVDDEWWGDYNYRAFNVSALSARDISNEAEEVIKHFRVYVPKYAYVKNISENDAAATVSFLKISETNDSDIFFIAEYGNGRLISVNSIEERKELHSETLIDLETDGSEGNIIKAFVFDSSDNLKPLSNV